MPNTRGTGHAQSARLCVPAHRRARVRQRIGAALMSTGVSATFRVLAPFAVGDVTYPLARKGAYATEQVAGAISGRNLLHRNVLTSQHQQRTAQAPLAAQTGSRVASSTTSSPSLSNTPWQ